MSVLDKFKPLNNPEVLKHAIEIQSIGNIAVHRAQEENRKLGIPNWYSVGGRIVCDIPKNNETDESNHRD
jgi:hypothetical protein